MRQILYVSVSTVPGDGADLAGILERSRHNNALDGITGLLWSDGHRFMQAIEGPRASIAVAFARIAADARHHSLDVLIDRRIDRCEFGGWAMAHRRAHEAPDVYDAVLARHLAQASNEIRAHFATLVATGLPAPTQFPPPCYDSAAGSPA